MMEKIPVFLMFKNQKHWTLKALEYLDKNTDPETYRLILINNGSEEKVANRVLSYAKDKFNDYCFVNHTETIGVSCAYMNAINKHIIDSDSFVILHNDVLVTKDWLEKMLFYKNKIFKDNDTEWSCIFPRTNYCTENTCTKHDDHILKKFIDQKPASKSFYDEELINSMLRSTYGRSVYGDDFCLNNYSKKIEQNNYRSFSFCEEICCFCTLFNAENFFQCGGFDVDFIKRRCECKLLNDISLSKNRYPTLAMDIFVHHHGNLTTDGPGNDFRKDFDESEKLYKEKLDQFYKKQSELDRYRTALLSGGSFLFIRDGGIGDIIMSMFSLQALKNNYENIKIVYMTKKENMKFVKGFKCVDEVIPINLDFNFSYFEKENFYDSEIMLNLKERYDFVKNWIKYVEYEDKRDVHRIVKFAESLSLEGLKPEIPEYHIDEKSKNIVEEIFKYSNKKKIVICMDGTCDIRSIPEAVGHKIIDLESKKGNQVFVVGNSKKINLDKFEKKENIIDMGFDLNIEDLPALIKLCEYVYTPDTGIFHIASLVGTPCKAFFGAIDPSLRDGGFYGAKNKIYYKKGILPCVPCRDMGCSEIPCMKYTEEEIERIVDEQC